MPRAYRFCSLTIHPNDQISAVPFNTPPSFLSTAICVTARPSGRLRPHVLQGEGINTGATEQKDEKKDETNVREQEQQGECDHRERIVQMTPDRSRLIQHEDSG